MKLRQLPRAKLFTRKNDPTNWIIGFLVASLVMLPFVSAFNDLLTNWVISLKTYQWLSNYIVPIQVRWVVVLLRLVGIAAEATPEYIIIPVSGKKFLVELIWNCIGWQSLVMFVISAVVMVQGGFSIFAKIKAITLGFIGTIMVNTIRITIVITLYRFAGGVLASVFHDYGALLTNTLWLVGFWWFSYNFILDPEERYSSPQQVS